MKSKTSIRVGITPIRLPMEYGDGLGKLMYKGKEIKPKKMVSGIAYFQHIYKTSYNPLHENKGRHACLKNGYWWFENLRQYPLDLIDYLKIKL